MPGAPIHKRVPVRAILFDLDQTLTDRPGSILKICERFMQRFGGDLAPASTAAVVLARMVELDMEGYRPRKDFFAELLKALSWLQPPEVTRIEDFWNNQYPRCTLANPGAEETLRRLKERGLKLGIVTNGHTAIQKAKVKTLGLGSYFDAFVISEAIGCHKPDPRIFQAALDALQVTPQETWFVGDHPLNDIAGARALGMRAIWIGDPSQWPAGLAPPRHTIRGLKEVVELTHGR